MQSLAWVDGRIAITYMDNLVTSSVYMMSKEELINNDDLERVYEDVPG